MKFDVSRVYTAANADELQPGDKVFISDYIGLLKKEVEEGTNVYEIKGIGDESHKYRFKVENGEWLLAYLIKPKPKQEKVWRPYKDCSEMVKDFTQNTPIYNPRFHPVIWLKQKNGNRVCNATMFSNKCVFVNEVWNSLSDLLKLYTYLDGTPCGVEE